MADNNNCTSCGKEPRVVYCQVCHWRTVDELKWALDRIDELRKDLESKQESADGRK